MTAKSEISRRLAYGQPFFVAYVRVCLPPPALPGGGGAGPGPRRCARGHGEGLLGWEGFAHDVVVHDEAFADVGGYFFDGLEAAAEVGADG